MSFTDLDRSLSTPPLSPNYRDDNLQSGSVFTAKTVTTTTTTSAKNSASSNKNLAYSPASPPVKSPNGIMQIPKGSVGNDNISSAQLKNPHAHTHSPFPPPVSPNRSSNNPMSHHSRILEDNTRFDTPRPTLTPSTANAASNSNIAKDNVTLPVTPRSPHTGVSPTSSNQPNGGHRILGESRPGDLDRRQVLSPPTSPPQFLPSTSPFNAQYRGFVRADNRGPPDSGVTIDTVINIDGERSIPSPVNSHAQRSIVSGAFLSSSSSSSSSLSASDQEHDYDLMVRHVSQQIFNISSNIAVLERLVPCLGQRRKDTPEMRASLHAVLETTQDLVKSSHRLLKILAKYHQPPTAGPRPSIGIRAQKPLSPNEMTSWQKKVLASRRQTHQRLTKDLSLVSRSFQELQKQAIESERKQVATLRRLSGSASLRRLSARRSDLMDLTQEEIEAGALSETVGNRWFRSGSSSSNAPSNIDHDRELSVQEEALLREILAIDGELVFQESIIQERESEIQKIEEGMGEVLDVMRELGTLVHEQRGGVDFLHDNILQTRGRIQLAQQEVLKASEYQRRSREKLCYIIMILSTVVAIVMLAFVGP
ncbi:Syntaxin-7 [Entomortierella beljakovae]|nr:Syntaxin-7 [Entomortierella beljakovae]